MLYIIDGSGEFSDKNYKRIMLDSFCCRMEKEFAGKYHRGPVTVGTDTYFIADHVYDAIRADPMFGKRPLFLAGHSRGGAGVIYIAQRLKDDGVFVDGMFLFDAVDRTITTKNVQTVPRNVRLIFHARRDTSLATYFEWGANDARQKFWVCQNAHQEDWAFACAAELQTATKYQRLDDAMKVRMRAITIVKSPEGSGINFGNCGLGLNPACTVEEVRWPCEYSEQIFLGSHGAIGGSPIGEQDGSWNSDEDKMLFSIIQNNDRAAMNSVWSWVESNFRAAHLGLHDSPFYKQASSKLPLSDPGEFSYRFR